MDMMKAQEMCIRDRQYTPEELTQLHQVLYEILEEIVRICDKHNIPYFVLGEKCPRIWGKNYQVGRK